MRENPYRPYRHTCVDSPEHLRGRERTSLGVGNMHTLA